MDVYSAGPEQHLSYLPAILAVTFVVSLGGKEQQGGTAGATYRIGINPVLQ
jgi:hypothetical protein